MKKIFLSLLALCGMVAGFTLSSCGGGGGGNLAGTTILLQSGQGYYIQFAEKLQGTNQSYAARMWNDGGEDTDLWVTVLDGPGYNDEGKLISLDAKVSVTTIDYADCEIFYYVLNAIPDDDDDEEVTTASLYAPAHMTISPVSDQGGVIAVLKWTLVTLIPETDPNDDTKITGYKEGAQVMPEQNVIGSY